MLRGVGQLSGRTEGPEQMAQRGGAGALNACEDTCHEVANLGLTDGMPLQTCALHAKGVCKDRIGSLSKPLGKEVKRIGNGVEVKSQRSPGPVALMVSA